MESIQELRGGGAPATQPAAPSASSRRASIFSRAWAAWRSLWVVAMLYSSPALAG